jgi:predicted unusual protein kinase regulating ubiquinone biosynthesis (AarF/ABC1/UbiB family)
VYYGRFKDRHRLLIHYLMAEPERRTAALFQASGPALQKVVQMIGDYANNPAVRSQLGELKSGVRPYGEKDIRPIIDAVLSRSTTPEILSRLTVDYEAIGSGTIAQAHIVTMDKGLQGNRL